MKVLLDECLPKPLCRLLIGHEAKTVPQAGWKSIKNGKLLALAEKEFDVFITVDRGIRHQNDMSELKLVIIVLELVANDIEAIKPVVPDILELINRSKEPGVYLVSRT